MSEVIAHLKQVGNMRSLEEKELDVCESVCKCVCVSVLDRGCVCTCVRLQCLCVYTYMHMLQFVHAHVHEPDDRAGVRLSVEF